MTNIWYNANYFVTLHRVTEITLNVVKQIKIYIMKKITDFENKLIVVALENYIETLENQPALSIIYTELKNRLEK